MDSLTLHAMAHLLPLWWRLSQSQMLEVLRVPAKLVAFLVWHGHKVFHAAFELMQVLQVLLSINSALSCSGWRLGLSAISLQGCV
jgi:hypothetical protein